MERSHAGNRGGIPPRKSWDWFVLLILIAASFHFARCYVTLSGSWISLSRYAAGTERMPYQGRMLMMWPIRWADHNSMLVDFAAHHVASCRSPDLIVVMIVATISLIATGLTLTQLYRRASTLHLFWWAPWALLLLISFTQYVLHSDNNFLYPYDLPGLFFFAAGIALIYSHKFLPLLLLFPIAVLNRETTIFLIPLLLIDGCCEQNRLRWQNLTQFRLLGKAATLLLVWAAVVFYVHHRFSSNPTDMYAHLWMNITDLLHPEHWAQLLSTGAFLWVPVCYFARDLKDFRLRMYLWIFPPWFCLMSYYGELLETRVFGELGGLLAIAAALIFEQRIFHAIKKRQGSADTQAIGRRSPGQGNTA